MSESQFTSLSGRDIADLRAMGRRVEMTRVVLTRDERKYVRVRVLRDGFRTTYHWAEAPELEGKQELKQVG